MKKILLLVALLSACLASEAKAQVFVTTPHFGFCQPYQGASGWADCYNTNFSVVDTTLWALSSPFQGAWSNTTSYLNGQYVTYGGFTYISTVTPNVGHTPGSSSQWQVITGSGGTPGGSPYSIQYADASSLFAGASLAGIVVASTSAAPRVANSGDIVALFASGTCAGFMRGDNTCPTTISLTYITPGAATAGTYDFSSATQLKLPIAPGYMTTASGEIGHDSTNHNWHIFANGVDNFIALFPSASPPTTGDLAKFVKTGNTWTLADAGLPPGSIVTSISIVTANGLQGSSSGGTTPALTIGPDSSHLIPINTGSVAQYLNAGGTYTAVNYSQLAGSVPAITALTGDGTASGPGSVALTLATVNSGPGLCGDATHVCVITTDGKGRVTLQSATAITAASPFALTFAITGGVAPTGTYNGGSAVTIDYHSLGAAGLAAANTFTNANIFQAVTLAATGTATSSTNFASYALTFDYSYWNSGAPVAGACGISTKVGDLSTSQSITSLNCGVSSLLNYFSVPGLRISNSYAGNYLLAIGNGSSFPLMYVDQSGNGYVGGTLTMNSTKILGLANGSASTDAVAFGQLPQAISAVSHNFLTSYSGGSAGTYTQARPACADLSDAGSGCSSSSSISYPGAGIANSTGSSWGTSYSTTGAGSVVVLATSPTFVTPLLGTPTSGVITNLTGTCTSCNATNITTSSNTSLTSLVNLATVGTITTGVWNGTRLTSSYIPTDVALVDANNPWIVTQNFAGITGTSSVILTATSPFMQLVSGTSPNNEPYFDFMESTNLKWRLASNDLGSATYDLSIIEGTNSTYKLQILQGTTGAMYLNQSGGHVLIGTTTDCGQVLCVAGSGYVSSSLYVGGTGSGNLVCTQNGTNCPSGSSYTLGGSLSSGNISFGAGAGTSPTLLNISGLDGSFIIEFTTGAAPSASSTIFTVTFTTTRGHIAFCVINPNGATALTGVAQAPYQSGTSATSLTSMSGTVALTSASTYAFIVSCP